LTNIRYALKMDLDAWFDNICSGINDFKQEIGMSEEQKPEEQQNKNHDDWMEGRWGHRHGHRGMGIFPGLFFGLLLIVVGVLLYANSMGWLTGEWWWYILIGIGAIMIIEALVRFALSKYRWGAYGRLVFGLLLMLIGLAFLLGWNQWWPLILVAIGVAIVLGSIFRRM
jgi:hypothetical protein